MNVKLFLLGLALVALALASSHSEAPGSAKRPQTDLSDLYCFVSYETGKQDHLVCVMNFQPTQNPQAGPNYYAISTKHFYQYHFDNNHDGVEDMTIQMFAGQDLGGTAVNGKGKKIGQTLNIGGVDVPIALKFSGQIKTADQSALNFLETYRMNVIYGAQKDGTQQAIKKAGTSETVFTKPADNAGSKTFPEGYENYANQYIYSVDIPGCNSPGRVFVGQRKASFAIKLGKVFDLLNFNPLDTSSDPNANTFKNLNVDSFVLELPFTCVKGDNDIVGVWATVATLKHENGLHVAKKQTNRMGMPLVNELVVGISDKGKFNKRPPTRDGELLTYVTNPTFPAIVSLLFTDAVNAAKGTSFTNIAPTNFPRNDLVATFLTGLEGVNKPANVVPSEMIRVNLAVAPTARESQNSLGVLGGDNAGFPNGRRLGDDVVDAVMRVAMGALCHSALAASVGCSATDAVVGAEALSDQVPISATDFLGVFPFMNTPLGGDAV